MKRSRHSTARFAICVDNSEYPASLELHKLYRVIPDEDAKKEGDLRIIDESGEDYLYPVDYFLLVDMPRGIARALKESFARSSAQAGYHRRFAPDYPRAYCLTALEALLQHIEGEPPFATFVLSCGPGRDLQIVFRAGSHCGGDNPIGS